MTDQTAIPHANDVLREMLEEHVDRFLDVVRGVIDERPEGLATPEGYTFAVPPGYTFAVPLRPNDPLVQLAQERLARSGWHLSFETKAPDVRENTPEINTCTLRALRFVEGAIDLSIIALRIALSPEYRDEERARREMTLGDYLAAHKTTLDEILGSEEEEEARGHDDGACKALWKNEYKIGPRREKAGGKS